MSGIIDDKKSLTLSEGERQVILDSLSNTIFNQELTDDTRKNASDLCKAAKGTAKKIGISKGKMQ